MLGVAEAGFFPGILLYLTYWFPSARRGRSVALFMSAIPISGIIGGALSGFLLKSFVGVAGLSSRQWLLVLEALPSIILGVVGLFYLDNGIREAAWLTDEEKDLLETNVKNDSGETVDHNLRAVFTNAKVWRLAITYFTIVAGIYGVTFWLPTMIRALQV